MHYVNATGLMWENAPEFGAMLLWAEHRYYGRCVHCTRRREAGSCRRREAGSCKGQACAS